MSNPTIEIGGIKIGNSSESDLASISSNTNIFHALIMSNFSGHKNSASLKPKFVDRDNFDDILASINPSITINPTNNPDHEIQLTFSELEDFEPDALFEKLNIFAELRRLRRRLSNNTTFEAAAKEINAWQPTPTVEHKAPEPALSIAEGESLLDSLISETEHRQEQRIQHAGEDFAQSLIQSIVAPYIIPAPHPQQAEMVAAVDKSIGGLMSLILHHPDFKALEASWRSLYFLIRRIDTSVKLKLFYVDIAKNELQSKLSGDDIDSSDIYKTLIEPYTSIAGATPWSLIVGDYFFGDAQEDIQLLEKMGLLAQQSNATFVAAANSELVNCQDLGKTPDIDNWQLERDAQLMSAWSTLRALPQAAHIALTFPRILLRLPYGKNTKAIESFNYEEMQGSEHENYLWGNAAFAVLYLLSESFNKHNFNFVPGESSQINNLPAHTYKEDGEIELKPCAEIYLTEKAGERLLENGLLPVWSILRSDSVRLGPFSSLHISNQRINGRWKS